VSPQETVDPASLVSNDDRKLLVRHGTLIGKDECTRSVISASVTAKIYGEHQWLEGGGQRGGKGCVCVSVCVINTKIEQSS